MSANADRPQLSICIVNWNTKNLLKDCLNSIYADPQIVIWEVVVVDNASTDDSVQMVRSTFPQVHLVISDENLGFVGGNNLAIERARGDYLLLLNSDTRVEPGVLGSLVDFLASHPEAGAAGPRLVGADGGLQLSCGRPPGLASEFVNKLLLHKLLPFFKFGRWDHAEIREVGWITGACLLVRREVVEQLGPLDPAIFMFYEDLEFCMRIRRAGWKILYHPFSQILHLGGQSTRKNLRNMLVISQRSLFYLFQKHFGRGHLHFLRLLTAVEMVLRSLVWGFLFLFLPARRSEARQRLQAYRQIFWKSLAQRSYWSPLE
ncbi:MAG: glycosyltransferase family 2 protein [Gemmatimonadetes bacterium]|jgi:N-acetylglucosaminyl-diphospho-decaprenol L-rhamnosyltransferase|nr:glycosyltransferase family 2 protein [Gemmatimonadota bacterium]